ncbi:MAG: hypothetical protein IPP48_12860 [Chitinophagaceae bacterium]|nr:hypothetical protein [Chitinophagaceae bacterium]
MKKKEILIAATVIAFALSACNSSTNETAKLDASNLNNYVDSVKAADPVYTIANWSTVNDGYQARVIKVENSMGLLETADKTKVAESKLKYAQLKEAYETKLKEKEAEPKITMNTTTPATPVAPDYRQALRNRLFGEGKIGADIKFDYVTAKNILSVYKNFVNTVADNKNSYTREDWDEIKVLYEALDTRKNSVEKDLASADNMKIAGLKIRFATIKATNRGGTKGAENEAAKQ